MVATERNRKAAERIEIEARQAVEQGKGHLLKIQAVPFNEAAAKFLLWCQMQSAKKPNTWKRTRTSLSSLVEHLGKRPVSSIQEGDVMDYITWRRKTHQVRDVTIRHDLHALSKFFRFALKHHWCRENPVKAEDIPSDAESVRINPLSIEQERSYFHAAEQFPHLHDLGRLMILQGCRPEELLLLKPEHIDLERGYLRIVEGKSKAAKRKLKLTPEAKAILASRIDHEWIFPAIRNERKKLSLSTCQKWHKRVLQTSAVTCVIYDLRHTFATRQAAAGASLPALASALGHNGIRSLMKYIHMSQEDMDKLFVSEPFRAVGPLQTGTKTERLT